MVDSTRPYGARLMLVALGLLPACLSEPIPLDTRTIEANLSSSQRRARCEVIRDVAAANGLTNGVLLAGIADAETGLAHCWSEATWACQGPHSDSCNGPVIAGAGDGPCADRQGGLGMFQFDGGNYEQTLARDGEEILLLEGNIAHAIDFVTSMLIRSQYVDVSNRQEALDWMNMVPMSPGDSVFDAWISTVTHYYNGCAPSYSCWNQRFNSYSNHLTTVYSEMGEDFWGDIGPPPPPPVCVAVPSGGRIVEEDDDCYEDGGNPAYWRTADAGHGGRLRWTHAFTGSQPDNFGIWNLNFETEGRYRLEVYTASGYGQSALARYTVQHAGSSDEVILDQSQVDGFQPLGEFEFTAGGDQWIRLDDNTGEAYSDMLRLAFDAVSIVPAGAPSVPDAGSVDSGHEDAGALAPDAGASPDATILPKPAPPEEEEGGCGCSTQLGPRASAVDPIFAVWLAALCVVGRGRRSR